jgi:opacity protein-like surface antigen
MNRDAGMTGLKAIVAGCIGALGFAAAAHAADPSWRRPPPLERDYEPPAPRYRELLSGWYVRGDLGYRWNHVGSVASPTAVTKTKYDNAIEGTFGFGYKYQWLRADLTVDRGVPSKISATTASGAAQPQYTAKVGSTTYLANAYLDMGTWFAFTPYVGAGAGVVQLKSQNYVDTGTAATVAVSDGQALNFAWAAMAGVAFQTAPNWMIDVGFRHLSLGNVAAIDSPGIANNAAVFKNLTAQEVRIGIRFLFD